MKRNSMQTDIDKGYGQEFKLLEKVTNIPSDYLVIESERTIGRYEVLVTPKGNGTFIVSIINFKYAVEGSNAYSMSYSLIEKGMNPVDAKEIMSILAQGYGL